MRTLCDIDCGQKAVIKHLLSEGSIRRRLLDLGFAENAEVKCLGKAPSGNPRAFLIRGTVVALRIKDCQNIIIY